MTNYTIGDIIKVAANANAGEGETVLIYKWKWNDTKFGENIDTVSIDTSDMLAGNYNLSLEVQNSCNIWSTPYSENITLVESGEEETPAKNDTSKIYGIIAGIGLGALLLFKNK